MSTVMLIGLYVAVAAVIFGLLAAFKAAMHRSYIPRSSAEWASVGIGKTFRSEFFEDAAALLTAEWSYASADDPSEDVYFSDPVEAYTYVLAAVKEKNRVLDKLENTQYNGMSSNYEWLWTDTHYERAYWMDELNEFREDCDGQI